MKIELEPTTLADGALTALLTHFEHAPNCGLRALELQAGGKSLAHPTRLRVRCRTCAQSAQLPTPAHFLRAWNRRPEPAAGKIVDTETTP